MTLQVLRRRVATSHQRVGTNGGGAKMRAYHRTLALRALCRRTLSRAALAEAVGVTRAAAADIAKGLIADGYVAEVGTTEARGGGGGRPGVGLALNPAGPVVMGVEIGHDRLRAVIMNFARTVIASDEIRCAEGALMGGGDFNAVCDLALGLSGALLHTAGIADQLMDVAIAVPGFTDRLGRLVAAPLFGWGDVPLAARFHTRLGASVHLANDANLCAFAETHASEDETAERDDFAEPAVLVVLLETGVGGGFVQGGRFLAGSQGLGCELGHIGGRDASAEAAAAPRLEERFGKPNLLARAAKVCGAIDGPSDLIARVAAGDPATVAFALAEGTALCEVLADLVYLFNPSRIVLAGEMAEMFAPVLGKLADAIGGKVLARFPKPTLSLCAHGREGAVVGAALFAHAALITAAPAEPLGLARAR